MFGRSFAPGDELSPAKQRQGFAFRLFKCKEVELGDGEDVAGAGAASSTH